MADLDRAIADAVERTARMTPAEREAMYRAQRRSFMRAEVAFGGDQDEAAYRAAVARGDESAVARLEAEATARVDAVDAHFDSLEGKDGDNESK